MSPPLKFFEDPTASYTCVERTGALQSDQTHSFPRDMCPCFYFPNKIFFYTFFNGAPLKSVSVKLQGTIPETLFQADIYKFIAFDKKVAFSNAHC